MSKELDEKISEYLKKAFSEQTYGAIFKNSRPESNNYTWYLKAFTDSLTQPSLSFSFFEAKESRRQGNFNKAMLLVSELVRDHITSLRTVQNIFDQIHGDEPRQVVFKRFSQKEPLEVGLENAPHVILIIDQFITPWKQTNIETVAEYLETEKQLEIEQQKTEVFKRLASAQNSFNELKEQEEILEKLDKNQNVFRFSIGVSIIDLTKEIINKIAVHLDDIEKNKTMIRLLKELVIVALSNIETKSMANAAD